MIKLAKVDFMMDSHSMEQRSKPDSGKKHPACSARKWKGGKPSSKEKCMTILHIFAPIKKVS